MRPGTVINWTYPIYVFLDILSMYTLQKNSKRNWTVISGNASLSATVVLTFTGSGIQKKRLLFVVKILSLTKDFITCILTLIKRQER